MRIGVLALQGAFQKHQEKLESINVISVQIRKAEDLKNICGLIIPGGESTTLSYLINEYQLGAKIISFAKSYPVMGTCAGLILMSQSCYKAKVNSFNIIGAKVERNAYGRQTESFTTKLASSEFGTYEGVFIRAPKIVACEKNVQVLTKYGGQPVCVRDGKHLAMSFHPELSRSNAVHEYFTNICKNADQ